ncbi:MAG: alpha/beta hydrolase [Thiomonas sp. 20-64-5]|nr:MAG: alpha/beta hydrolase [Thiomonas sp. 20-64-5]
MPEADEDRRLCASPAQGRADCAPEQDLTPRMRELLQRIARAGQIPLHRLSPAQARAAYARMAQVLDFPPAPLPLCDTLDCPSRDGVRLPLRRYASRAADWQTPQPALLYLHGGGFVIGSAATHDALCRQLALRSGWMVLSLDYRLAPEHLFPTAFNDSWDALQWLHAHGGMLGADTHCLAVGGDSAGGTLAAACALAARDATLPLALQLLFYPGMGCSHDTLSQQRYAHGFLLERAQIDWFFGLYLRGPQDCPDWRFAPQHAVDHRSLAPAWMAVAGCDPLRDEALAYAELLRQSGVQVTAAEWPGVTHDFLKLSRALPEATQAVDAAALAVRAAALQAGAVSA